LPSQANAYSLGRSIDNLGKVTWQANSITVTNGANITNENGALFDAQVDNNILDGGAGVFLVKSGATLQKSKGAGTTRIDVTVRTELGSKIRELTNGRIKFSPFFGNLASITVEGASGGIDFASGFQQDGGSTSLQANGASMTVAGGNLVLKGGTMSLTVSGASITETGQIQQSGGTVNLIAYTNVNVSDQYLESGGSIELGNGGNISAANGMQISSTGVLEGTGFITVTNRPLTNGGTINPGWGNGNAGLGSIGITGAYVQTSSGYLDVAIFSSSGSTTCDQLSVSGVATLGGTLNVTLYGQSPPPGATLEPVTYSSRGSSAFAAVNVPSGWTWWYNDTNPPDGVDVQLRFHF
jgi:hypothetical protein